MSIDRRVWLPGLFAVAGVLISFSVAAAFNRHSVETLKHLRSICMTHVENRAFCACAEHAVRVHIPSGTLRIKDEHKLELDESVSSDVYDAANAAVAYCGVKFEPEWEG